MTVLQRFHIAEFNPMPANCIGTALFLAGLTEKDESCSSTGFYTHYFSRLKKVERPTLGNLVAWEILEDSELVKNPDKNDSEMCYAKIVMGLLKKHGSSVVRYCSHLAYVFRINPNLVLMTRNGEYFDITGHDEIPGHGENAVPKIQDFDVTNAKYFRNGISVNFYTY
jgi:hypothetical protein